MLHIGGFSLLQAVREAWLLVVISLVAAVSFFGSPGGYAESARSVLHGLCAQAPSHTIQFDGRALPFDARMTGIYGGFLMTFVSICAMGRLWRFGNPPTKIMVLLASLVMAMAVDGFNSLLNDLQQWHPYEPSNWMRVITGYGTGVALAVGLSWLVASTTWHLGSSRIAVDSFGVLLPAATGLLLLGSMLWARPGWLHLPVTILLVVSAWSTVSLLILVMVLLTFRIDDRVRTLSHLHVPAAIAMLLGISVMLGLAGARFWLEHSLGISNAMM
jgi:uncharacterized membrane protein